MPNLADASSFQQQSVGRTLWEQWAIVDIGGAGAASIANGNQSGDITVTLNGAGTYDVTFKACATALPGNISLKSAAKTVVGAIWTAFNAAAGTGTFKTLAGVNAAADTNPASGDQIGIRIEGAPKGAG